MFQSSKSRRAISGLKHKIERQDIELSTLQDQLRRHSKAIGGTFNKERDQAKRNTWVETTLSEQRAINGKVGTSIRKLESRERIQRRTNNNVKGAIKDLYDKTALLRQQGNNVNRKQTALILEMQAANHALRTTVTRVVTTIDSLHEDRAQTADFLVVPRVRKLETANADLQRENKMLDQRLIVMHKQLLATTAQLAAITNFLQLEYVDVPEIPAHVAAVESTNQQTKDN